MVGALTWPHNHLRSGALELEEFCASLAAVRDAAGVEHRADLTLCAGAKVRPGNHADSAMAQAVWKAWGRPMLFESPPASEARNRWVLVDNGTLTDVRHDQHVFKDKHVTERGSRTVSELLSGGGVIHLVRGGVVVHRLVLLVCAEANILKPNFTGERSIVAGGFGANAALPDPFADDWVLLHPAHHPYWPHIGHRGFCLVGSMHVKGGGESVPLFRKLVTRTADHQFADKSRPPVAVVHAAPFHRSTDARGRRDEDFSTRYFDRRRTVSKPLVRLPLKDEVTARYAQFTLRP